MSAASQAFHGVLVPVLTPFTSTLDPDTKRFTRFCHWLLTQGAHGLAVFGTTSEANSLALGERMSLLQALVEAGVPAQRLLPGTGTCALPDSVELTRHALAVGCKGVLVLPPFYYKNVSDEGLYAGYSELIQRVGDNRLKIYLYHIPQMSYAPLNLKLIERLTTAYPQTILGIKDSSGDWDNTQAIMREYPHLAVFPSSESRLLDALRLGGAGCISATANVNVAQISTLANHWQSEQADALHQSVSRLRSIFETQPLIPALKDIVAHFSNDPGWRPVRPPLTSLSPDQAASLRETLQGIDFQFPFTAHG